jgi:hypothetical protein
MQSEPVAQTGGHLHRLVLPQHAVVDEDRRELIADGLGHEQRGDGGVDATADRGDGPFPSDRNADFFDSPSAVIAEVPRRLASGDVKEEIAQDLRPRFRVRHLRMKQDPEALPLEIFKRGDGCAVGARRGVEARRRREDAVPVAGPHALPRRGIGEEARFTDELDVRASIFALRGRFDLAAQEVRRQLHPIADRQNRNAELEHFARTVGRRLSVDRLRAAGENDRSRG